MLETGRALVIALNKWDGMEQGEKDYVKTELERRLFFVDYADIHFISAKHGTGVGHLYKSVQAAFKSAITRWPTSRLTQILEDAVREHQPPMVNSRRIKLRYAHLGGANPPLIVIHGNQVDAVPKSYTRYLENTYRRVLKLVGTPIRIEYKGGDNPYEARRTRSPTARSTRSGVSCPTTRRPRRSAATRSADRAFLQAWELGGCFSRSRCRPHVWAR